VLISPPIPFSRVPFGFVPMTVDDPLRRCVATVWTESNVPFFVSHLYVMFETYPVPVQGLHYPIGHSTRVLTPC